MKLKTLIVSVLILAALSAVVFFMRRPGPPLSADARLQQPLLDRALVDKAAKVRISDQGKSVVVTRQADATWRVPTYFDLPADFQKLSSLVGNLTEAKLDRVVTSRADKIERLEFKDTKVELLDAADKELWSVTLGKAPELGSGRYVRFGSEQKAFLANLNTFLDTEAKNWANPELLNLKADDIAKFELSFPGGATLALSRAKKDDPWTADKTPDNQRVNASRVATTLGPVVNLRFSDTTDPTDTSIAAAKANQRTVKLTTFDQKTVTIAMGRKPEEKKLKPSAPTPAAEPKPADAPADATAKADPAKPDDKPKEPEYDTIPAGPVFVTITHSDAAAPVNALMQKRAFQVSDYPFTGLPQKPEDLFEPAPAPTPPPPPLPATPATEPKKP